MSKAEDLLELQIKAAKLPQAHREFRFHPVRKWRFDFAWPAYMIAVEIEGAVWSGGRHTRGKGFTEDCHKYNQATHLGWRIYRFTTEMVNSGEALQTIEADFENNVQAHK